MNIRELTSIKVTAAKKKERKVPGYWNIPDLMALVEKCLNTGEEQSGEIEGIYYAVVKPGGPFTKELMEKAENKDKYHACHITFYSRFFHFMVEKSETEPYPFAKQD